MDNITTETNNAPTKTVQIVEQNIESVPAASAETAENVYQIDERFRKVPVEYPEHKIRLEHDFKAPDKRELQHYYFNAPSLSVFRDGERQPLGSPESPAAELHDQTVGAMRRTAMSGEVQKEYSRSEIRDLIQSAKAEAVGVYLNAYYDVELKSESGDLDDILFGKSNAIEAVVKIRPTGKVEKTFSIFLNRPDDLTFSRFTQQSEGSAIINPKRDELLVEFLGQERLSEITGGEDEGDRVLFQKTTQFVRTFFDIFDKAFVSASGISFEGAPYDAEKHKQILGAIDPVLKLKVAAALRNFI